jgi:hypothetical protein
MELRLYGDYGWQKADQFGLWPLSAATLDALLYMQIKSCLPFSNSNPLSALAANCLDQLPRFFQKKASLNGS